MGHIIGLPNPAAVLSNLATQLRSIILFNKVMKDDSANLLATPLETKLLSYKKSEVFAVIKELEDIYKNEQ